jgi:hypothetical protein
VVDGAGWQSLHEAQHKVSGGYSLNDADRKIPIPKRTAFSTGPVPNVMDWTESRIRGIPRNIGALSPSTCASGAPS